MATFVYLLCLAFMTAHITSGQRQFEQGRWVDANGKRRQEQGWYFVGPNGERQYENSQQEWQSGGQGGQNGRNVRLQENGRWFEALDGQRRWEQGWYTVGSNNQRVYENNQQPWQSVDKLNSQRKYENGRLVTQNGRQRWEQGWYYDGPNNERRYEQTQQNWQQVQNGNNRNNNNNNRAYEQGRMFEDQNGRRRWEQGWYTVGNNNQRVYETQQQNWQDSRNNNINSNGNRGPNNDGNRGSNNNGNRGPNNNQFQNGKRLFESGRWVEDGQGRRRQEKGWYTLGNNNQRIYEERQDDWQQIRPDQRNNNQGNNWKGR